MDRRVEEAMARFRLLPRAEYHRLAAGPYEAQAVLLLAEPPLAVEAKYLASVAHLQGHGTFLALQSALEERGNVAGFVARRKRPAPARACLAHSDNGRSRP